MKRGCNEKFIFFCVMLLLGLCALTASLLLWRRMPPPRFASAAAIPLFASVVWTLSALFLALQNRTDSVGGDVEKPVRGHTRIILSVSALYALLLWLGASFYAVTAAYLLGLMRLLQGNFTKRIVLYSTVTMLLITLVFGRLFGISFS